MSTTTYQVTGMTCAHCVNAVQEELHTVPGVESVEITLIPDGVSTVTVTSREPLSRSAVRAAVDEAGYDLVSGPESASL